MKIVCDKVLLKPCGNLICWFAACVNQLAFKAIIGAVAPRKEELLSPDQGVPAKEIKKMVKREENSTPVAMEATPKPMTNLVLYFLSSHPSAP